MFKCISGTSNLTAANYFFFDKSDSFVTFIVDGKRLRINKSLICAASSVINNILEKYNSKENEDDEIKITDTTYDIFKLVIYYILILDGYHEINVIGVVQTHRNFNACILKHGVSMKLIANEQVKCQPRNKDYEDRQRLYATDGDLFWRRNSPSSRTRLPRKSTIPPTIASTTIQFSLQCRCRKWCVMWYIFFIVPFLGLSVDKNIHSYRHRDECIEFLTAASLCVK
ncbi:hypothetical protein ALC56_13703 [Trachymyrmex septentrionalis]|uniref:BTB domain-containing protein n=1 Tax=Trachymyrmex septentrionalis TaxID=34720 RepID=A0A195EUL7_9HYME|nr:hypothetical protein ALC56_13703 [Trachymyrmex septentrionalis]